MGRFMAYSLLSIPAVQKAATTAFAIIAAVCIFVALIILFIKKVIIPRKEDKKNQAEIQVQVQKEYELNKIWRANYQKINSALKTVFYAGLVDEWKDLPSMVKYEVKDKCPYCNGKLVKEEGNFNKTTNIQYSPTGKMVGLAHLWVGEEKPDGGYYYTDKTVCEKCRRVLYEESSSCVSGIDSKKDEMIWERRKSYTFVGVKWRNPNVESALGKEICDHIDKYGNLGRKVINSEYTKDRKYN